MYYIILYICIIYYIYIYNTLRTTKYMFKYKYIGDK